MASVPVPQQAESVEEKFQRFAALWRAETDHLSSSTLMLNHPAYQAIIALGPEVVPILLRELEKDPDHWFWALHVITGADPVAPADRGDFDKMVEAWLSWGRANHYQW